jgi:hypothetical protein
MKNHISQFYSCSEIKLACELYYVCELGKYSKLNHGIPLSLDGVLLNSVLKKSPIWNYFRMAVDEGWLEDTGVDANELRITVQHPIDNLKNHVVNYLFVLEEVPFNMEDSNRRKTDLNYDLRTPIRSQISFEIMKDEYWKWTPKGADEMHFLQNNKSLNHNRSDQAWLSLVAMVAVNRFYNHVPEVLWLKFEDSTVLNNMALAYLIILADETTCLNGWVRLDASLINQATYLQLSFTAWYAKGRDTGLCDRWYTGKEKYDYLKTLDITEGDLVMLYERDKSQRMNYVKTIAGCHLAKVETLTDDTIVFDVINTVKPYSTGKADFDDHTTIVKKMYNENRPYEKLNHSKMSLSLADIGVEYLLYNEKYFIIPLDESNDMRPMYVEDGLGNHAVLNLDQNNLTYWILKDYNVEFNEERFLKRYFPNKLPLYTRFMNGEQLEPECYYQDEEEN